MLQQLKQGACSVGELGAPQLAQLASIDVDVEHARLGAELRQLAQQPLLRFQQLAVLGGGFQLLVHHHQLATGIALGLQPVRRVRLQHADRPG